MICCRCNLFTGSKMTWSDPAGTFRTSSRLALLSGSVLKKKSERFKEHCIVLKFISCLFVTFGIRSKCCDFHCLICHDEDDGRFNVIRFYTCTMLIDGWCFVHEHNFSIKRFDKDKHNVQIGKLDHCRVVCSLVCRRTCSCTHRYQLLITIGVHTSSQVVTLQWYPSDKYNTLAILH
jgi:hypothetical protein